MSRIIKIQDHSIWRGHHRWTITLEDEHGRAQVSARGETESEALADAQRTFANRRIFTEEEKAVLRKTNDQLRRRLN